MAAPSRRDDAETEGDAQVSMRSAATAASTTYASASTASASASTASFDAAEERRQRWL